MNFHFSNEQEQFREFVRRFLHDVSPTTEVRRVMESETGYCENTWGRLSQELSLVGLCIPEAFGGSGFGVMELAIAAEEMGYALYPSPFFATSVLAAKSLELIGTEEQKGEYLPGMASGSVIATLAFMESSAAPDLLAVSTSAKGKGQQYRVSGNKTFVVDGMAANQLFVTAMLAEGLSLFLIDANAAGVTRRSLNVMDPTRRLASLSLVDAPGILMGSPGQAEQGLSQALDIAYIALANESVGGATRLLEDALAYIKLRRQFGRTIASFQAIKHKMTDYLVSVELAKSAAYYAAEAAASGSTQTPMLASLAKAGAGEAYLQAAIDSIQLHGGIGFTWENDTHLWFKRAKSSEVFLGDPTWHRARMIALMVEEQAA